MRTIAIVFLLFVSPLSAQQPAPAAANPLAQTKEELKRVLAEAALPFSASQENAITLMMEDRRKASEDLFGGLMDFTAGPTQGEQADRLRSAIEWMRNEFNTRLQDYLTPPQIAVWSRHLESGARPVSAGAPVARPVQQTQYVRINNNPFTTEDDTYRFARQGSGSANETEVIQRGGVGAFHGNFQLLLKDESLNAGRRFARNKPPYQERRTTFDFGGPIIRGLLTSNFGGSQIEAENVDTIRATLPDEIFSLGITRPTTQRTLNVRNIFQLADGHSLSLNANYGTDKRRNQGVGGFILPERAYESSGSNWGFEVQQFSALSSRSLFENKFILTHSSDETTPNTTGLRVNVIDAFSRGGAQNNAENKSNTLEFRSLYTRLGERLTVKTGGNALHRSEQSTLQNNFIGTFTFSSLDAYRQNRPVNFRVNRGDPFLDLKQWELSIFMQNDFKLTPRLTFMYGVRYETQTNLSDANNFNPRVGIAYAVSRATVIRAGGGIFQQRLPSGVVAIQRRGDGTRQEEIIIDNPSFPDPFQAGTIRNTFPSVRVIDSDLATPYNAVAMASFERTFLTNLFISAAYDFNKEIHRLRYRNLNAPLDITSPVPRSCSPGQSALTCVRPQPNRGNILNLESTGRGTTDTVRANFRERFSIFNVSASYVLSLSWGDSLSSGFLTGSTGGGNAGGGGSDNFGFGTEANVPSDNYDLAADWARVSLPVHTINATVNARLPLGIFLTQTMTSTLDRTYGITTGRDDNQDTVVNDRPPGVKRNSIAAPNTLTFNFNVSKAFFFGSARNGGNTRTNMNLFANMTNAFNRPNYSAPSGVMTSPNFGRSTSAGAPREIEVGLRFQF